MLNIRSSDYIYGAAVFRKLVIHNTRSVNDTIVQSCSNVVVFFKNSS